jgi:hypothetical protein
MSRTRYNRTPGCLRLFSSGRRCRATALRIRSPVTTQLHYSHLCVTQPTDFLRLCVEFLDVSWRHCYVTATCGEAEDPSDGLAHYLVILLQRASRQPRVRAGHQLQRLFVYLRLVAVAQLLKKFLPFTEPEISLPCPLNLWSLMYVAANHCLSCEVSTVVKMHIAVFWGMTPCSLVDVEKKKNPFGATNYLCHGTVRFIEILSTICPYPSKGWCYVPNHSVITQTTAVWNTLGCRPRYWVHLITQFFGATTLLSKPTG